MPVRWRGRSCRWGARRLGHVDRSSLSLRAAHGATARVLRRMVGGARDARRIEDDVVVLPESLEEVAGLPLLITAAVRHDLHDLADRALPIDRAEQSVLTRIDGE